MDNLTENKTNYDLFPDQIEHFERCLNIISSKHGYIDLSPPGTGKSHIARVIAQTNKFPLFIVCPKSVIPMWEELCFEYDLDLEFITTYQSLRSTKGHQPFHGYLERIDTVTSSGKNKCSFRLTEKSKTLFDHGVFIIVDEFQHIKNNSHQHNAVKTLISGIFNSSSSRFGLLSGTPFDKEEMAINLLRLLGLVVDQPLYSTSRSTGDFKALGIQGLIDVCSSKNRIVTEMVIREFPLCKRNIDSICFQLWLRVIRPEYSSGMRDVVLGVDRDSKNGYYNISEEDNKILSGAIKNLIIASRYNEETNTLDEEGSKDMSAIKRSNQDSEFSKVNLVARLAMEDLKANPNCKVILVGNYKITLQRWKKMFDSYGVKILEGDTTLKDREKNIKDFMDPKGSRVLIGNMAVMCEGISLHDTDGRYPRIMYIIPNYSVINLHQCSLRIHRIGVKSKATIRIVYVKGIYSCEKSIYNALTKKTIVLKENISGMGGDNISFPGEYKTYEEPDDPVNFPHMVKSSGMETSLHRTIRKPSPREIKGPMTPRREVNTFNNVNNVNNVKTLSIMGNASNASNVSNVSNASNVTSISNLIKEQTNIKSNDFQSTLPDAPGGPIYRPRSVFLQKKKCVEIKALSLVALRTK